MYDSSYSVSTDAFCENGEGMQKMTVKGNGVDECFTIPSTEKIDIFNMGRFLIIGDPEKNSICLFSDKPSVLVVIQDRVCTKKTYTANLLGTTCASSLILDSECRDIIQRIVDFKEKGKKYWDEIGNTVETVTSRLIEECPFKDKTINSEPPKSLNLFSFLSDIGNLVIKKTPFKGL